MTTINDFSQAVAGKTILVTGGTGSFGTTMVNHLRKTDVKQIRILSRDEWKQEAMRLNLGEARLQFHIGDVRRPASIKSAMRGVDHVFHAAALKQVPSCEFFPLEAVETNVGGSSNVIQAAIDEGVESVVLLSTDKAVRPANAMGMTKGLMEKVAIAAARQLNPGDTRIALVRYGNVLLSRGSVVPLFVRQAHAGEPLTVTDPGMTRFLMALEDAVDLVMYAFTQANQGDLFIKKSPATTIETLAEAVLSLTGSSQGVRVIGSRHGEKHFETLATSEELVRAEEMPDYYRVPLDDRDLDAARFFTQGEVQRSELADYDSATAPQLTVEQTVAALQDLDGMADLLAGATL